MLGKTTTSRNGNNGNTDTVDATESSFFGKNISKFLVIPIRDQMVNKARLSGPAGVCWNRSSSVDVRRKGRVTAGSIVWKQNPYKWILWKEKKSHRSLYGKPVPG
jgi:hypothetical protein